MDGMLKIIESNPSFLASQHLAKGLQCESCHHRLPPVGTPRKEICLACHGGSYAKLAALTQTKMNPHQSHVGEMPCQFCHYGHQPFDSQCSKCKHQTTGSAIQSPGYAD
jgi:fumarate reductase flavoprotein subunit